MQPGQEKNVCAQEGILIADVLHKVTRDLCAEAARKKYSEDSLRIKAKCIEFFFLIMNIKLGLHHHQANTSSLLVMVISTTKLTTPPCFGK